jgi:isoamylase
MAKMMNTHPRDLHNYISEIAEHADVRVKGIGPGQLHAYRVDGPYDSCEGHRFNVNRLLLDPCATAITRLPPWDFAAARRYGPSPPQKDLVLSAEDNSRPMPKCVFVNEPFDWNEDQPPRHPWSKTVIYEVHVRGFTIHPESGIDHQETYRGLTEKDSLSQDPGSHCSGTDAQARVRLNFYQPHESADKSTAHELLGLRSRGVPCPESLL